MDCSLQFALSNGQTSIDHVHPICLDIANGLFYLYNIKPNALIHHNLCGSNILLKADGPNWITKLSDLSLAQFTYTIAAQNTKVISHSTYTAPEISKHSSHHLQTAKVDIFSYIYGIVFQLLNYYCKGSQVLLFQRWLLLSILVGPSMWPSFYSAPVMILMKGLPSVK